MKNGNPRIINETSQCNTSYLHVHTAQLPSGQNPQEREGEHGDEAGNRDGDDFGHPIDSHHKDHEPAPTLLKENCSFNTRNNKIG